MSTKTSLIEQIKEMLGDDADFLEVSLTPLQQF